MNKMLRSFLLLVPLMLLTACGRGEVSFANDIKPVIDKHCISCHSGSGEGANASHFRMVDYASVMKGTALGPVVVPGSRLSSTFYLVVAGKTAREIRMPPHNTESFAEGRGVMLSADTIETIGRWIDQGAKDN